AATALYGQSQVDAYAAHLASTVLGNPHSAHAPSQASTDLLQGVRSNLLAFFDADPARYDVCLTPNTSAAIKLVAEGYAFGPRRPLVISADNHNSIVGMRQYAAASGAATLVLPLDAELRLEEPEAHLAQAARTHGPGLLAFPAQSNFSGVQHDLSLVGTAHALGYDVLLDAAAAGPAGAISLRTHPVAFLCCAFYKLFGLPTGLGALIVRRSALARLERPWFAGGTVDFVSIEHGLHRRSAGHAGFEDGTPNFLAAGAVEGGFALLARVPRPALRRRLRMLTARFLEGAAALRHADGFPKIQLYGPRELSGRGATVAFNLLAPDGRCVPYALVEEHARRARVAIRGGCFCNPGAGERAFGFAQRGVASCLRRLQDNFTHARLQQCLGQDATVGALRMSLGLPSNEADVDRLLAFIDACAALSEHRERVAIGG
ncbi:MAG TPA: aminotransferase class V-fold PLP-dependent enzyme, partial [Telluria sp.]|nr:aminotransferase class V-fold PLP-dependent enzyme [Telluria sp.]